MCFYHLVSYTVYPYWIYLEVFCSIFDHFFSVEAEKDPKEKGSYQWVIKIVPVQQRQYIYYFACNFEKDMKVSL